MATSTPGTPFASTADTKSVLLFDWWLVRVDGDSSGTKLAVSGFTTRGKQATRIFTSTPIVKRFDAYTLETADGIIVTIQGIINKSLMHHNGFPPEVSNRFLTGFPYSWDYYAEEYFAKASISASTRRSNSSKDEPHNNSCSYSGSKFPVQTDELPIHRALNLLNSILNTFVGDDVSTGSYSKVFSGSASGLIPMAQMPSNVGKQSPPVVKACSPEESPSRDTNKINQKRSKITIPLVRHDSELTAVTHAEGVECDKNALPPDEALGVVFEKDALSVFICSSSHWPVDHEEAEAARLLETGRGTMVDSTSEIVEKANHIPSVVVDPRNAEHAPECTEENLDGGIAKSVPGFAIGQILNHLVCMDLKHSSCKRDEELKHLIPCDTHVTDQLSVRDLGICKGSDGNDIVLKEVNLKTRLEPPADSDVTKSVENPKASRKKQKGHRKVSGSTSKGKTAVLSSNLVSNDYVNARNQNSPEVAKAGLSGFSESSSTNEIDNACVSILERVESCQITHQKDPSTQMTIEGDMKATSTSEVGVCSEKPPTAVKEPENTIEKDQGCTYAKNDSITHHSSVVPNESQADGRIRGRHFSHVTEKWPSVEKGSGETNAVDASAMVARKLDFITDKGQSSGSSSAFRSRSSAEKIKFSSRGGRKKLEDHPADSDNGTNMGKNLKGDQSKKSFISTEVKNGVRSGSDAEVEERDKSRPRYSQELINFGVERGDGDTIEKTSMDGTGENKPTKCSSKRSTTQASQPSIQEGHPIKEIVPGKIRKLKSPKENQSDASFKMQPKKDKAARSMGRTTIWRSSYPYVHQSMCTRHKSEKLSLCSPDSLNLKRSRSGRLLVPALPIGSQHIFYDADGTITGIGMAGLPFTGSKSEPPKKKKRHP